MRKDLYTFFTCFIFNNAYNIGSRSNTNNNGNGKGREKPVREGVPFLTSLHLLPDNTIVLSPVALK